MRIKAINHQRAWVVAVDMGYGHQRAAYPLEVMAHGHKIINANNYRGIPTHDRKIWHQSRQFYEFISRFKNVPIVGEAAFNVFDRFQEIPQFYPKRDQSAPTFQLKEMYRMMKNGWGKDLINKLEKTKHLPLISTFFLPAFMAEFHGYSEEIYCVICDADISRTWVPPDPEKSRINYLAPCYRVVDRLKFYGVDPDRIFLTGFPLPLENIGNDKLDILKNDFANRLINLDPRKRYLTRYHETIHEELEPTELPKKSNHSLTLTLAVGGAGAQKELAMQFVSSLKNEIAHDKISINLVAGVHNTVNSYFRQEVKKIGLGKNLEKNVKIIFAQNKEKYFQKFNKSLRTTDILWTKPSELSFYVALGMPIIMAPPIGSQEKFNQTWLRAIGAGINQEDPKYTNEWLFDWIKSGWFARSAMQGYLEGPRYGTYNVAKLISKKVREMKVLKPALQY
jgi:hypothetical protein